MKGSLNLWLLVIVGVCALSFWFGKHLVPAGVVKTDVAATAGGEHRLPRDGPAEPVHLLVLNGTDQGGLAREFGVLLGRTGCVAEMVGNAPHTRYEHSFLVNRRLSAERAGILATDLGGVPVLQEFDRRSSADAVLVLGRDAERLRKFLRGS